jgi:hypothetical protein
VPSDGPILVAFADQRVLDVRIEGTEPRRSGDTLYVLPQRVQVDGPMTFDTGMLISQILDGNMILFSKTRSSFAMGQGTIAVSYRPIGFRGHIESTRLSLALTTFEGGPIGKPQETIEPLEREPDYCRLNEPIVDCDPPPLDNLPDLAIFDRSGAGEWLRLPHFKDGRTYELADPERYVDPTSGTILIRFINEVQPETYFGLALSLEGDVR